MSKKDNKPDFNFVIAQGETPQKPTKAMPDVHSTKTSKAYSQAEKINKLPWQSPKSAVRARPSGREKQLEGAGGMEKSSDVFDELFGKSLFQSNMAVMTKAPEYEPTKSDLLNQLSWKVKELCELRSSSWTIEQEVPDAKEMAEKLFSKIKRDINELVEKYGKAKKSMPEAVDAIVKGAMKEYAMEHQPPAADEEKGSLVAKIKQAKAKKDEKKEGKHGEGSHGGKVIGHTASGHAKYAKKSGGDMDIFKAMGVSVVKGENLSMVDYEKKDTNAKDLLIKSGRDYLVMTDEQWSRYGGDDDPRARLEAQLSKGYAKDDDESDNYGAKNLKNTHGEDMHPDKIHAPDDKAEVVDPEHGMDKQEKEAGMKVKPGVIDKKESKPTTPPARKAMGTKWLTQDELLLKALDFDGIGKSQKIKKDDSIAAGIAAAAAANGGGQGNASLAQYAGKSASCEEPNLKKKVMKKGPIVDWAKEEEKEHKIAKKSLDPLDELVTIIKGGDSLIEMSEDTTDLKKLAEVHENSDFGEHHKNKSRGYNAAEKVQLSNKNPFVKAVGKGGVVMDFGAKTGNPIADYTTDLLNSQATPQEIYNAQYQRSTYNKALTDYVKSPDTFQEDPNTARPTGGVEKGWGDQLNKPMDQQVAEAFQKGDFDAKPKQPDTKFKSATLTLPNGEVLKGMSETDAAVIEMMKGLGVQDTNTGFTADVTGGGVERVVADCTLAK